MMRETCTITDVITPVWNDLTLDYDYIETVVYSGKCRVRYGQAAANTVEQAGQVATLHEGTFSLPVATSGEVRKGHLVTITASESDAALVGAKFRVGATRSQSDVTARRFQIEDTQ